jgi:hypothetical protein
MSYPSTDIQSSDLCREALPAFLPVWKSIVATNIMFPLDFGNGFCGAEELPFMMAMGHVPGGGV